MKSTIGNLITQTPDRLLTDREERKLTRRVAQGDQQARKKLVNHNYRLVISVAKDYKDMGVPFEDLLMAGFEGLVKGIDKFDPGLDNKLSTYATWWIRKAVFRELDQHSTTIRIPGYVRALKRQVRRLEKKREEELSPAGIRKEFGVSKEVARTVKRVGPTASLDSSFSKSSEDNLKKMVVDRKAEDPSRAVPQRRASERLHAAMEEKLSDRERRVIKLYYGVEDYKPRTLPEVGEVFNLSRERIRQLRDRALEKLASDRKLAGLRGDSSA